MKVLVDADACPVREIIVRLCREKHIPLVMVTDTSHRIDDGYSQVITVDKGRDSADLRLIYEVEKGDIVVTQDYGVAALALGKGCRAVSQDGLLFTGENIQGLLFSRHVGQKVRRGGGRTRGRKRGKRPRMHSLNRLSANCWKPNGQKNKSAANLVTNQGSGRAFPVPRNSPGAVHAPRERGSGFFRMLFKIFPGKFHKSFCCRGKGTVLVVDEIEFPL